MLDVYEIIEIWLITAHIRRMGGGTVFSLFVSTHPRGEGYLPSC